MKGGFLYTTLVLGSGGQSRTSLRPRIDEGFLKPEGVCHCTECAREKWRKWLNLGCHREWYSGFNASEKHWSFNADSPDGIVGLRVECFSTIYLRLLGRALRMYDELYQSYTKSKCMYKKHGQAAVADMYRYRYLSKYFRSTYLSLEEQFENLSPEERRDALQYTALAKTGRAALVEVRIDNILDVHEAPPGEDSLPFAVRSNNDFGLVMEVSKLKVVHDIDQLLFAPSQSAIRFIQGASPTVRQALHHRLDAIQYDAIRHRNFESYQKRIAEIFAFTMQNARLY